MFTCEFHEKVVSLACSLIKKARSRSDWSSVVGEMLRGGDKAVRTELLKQIEEQRKQIASYERKLKGSFSFSLNLMPFFS